MPAWAKYKFWLVLSQSTLSVIMAGCSAKLHAQEFNGRHMMAGKACKLTRARCLVCPGQHSAASRTASLA